jgi:hypothetical protein
MFAIITLISAVETEDYTISFLPTEIKPVISNKQAICKIKKFEG